MWPSKSLVSGPLERCDDDAIPDFWEPCWIDDYFTNGPVLGTFDMPEAFNVSI